MDKYEEGQGKCDTGNKTMSKQEVDNGQICKARVKEDRSIKPSYDV